MSRIDETIGFLSWNVCGLPSALPSPTRRAAEFGRMIEASDVEIVNLQEVWTRRLLASLRTRLPSFGFVAWRPNLAGQPAGGLVTFSRLPLGPVSYTPFHAPSPTGSPVFRTLKAVNSRLKGVLCVGVDGRRTLIGNVHLSANRDGDWSDENRHYGFQRAQLTALHTTLRRARSADTDLVIVSGDFNIPSTSTLYPQVVDHGVWRDPFAAEDLPTYHVELLPPGRPPHRIDYLLVSGDPRTYPVTEAALRFTEPVSMPGHPHTFLSDHVALAVRIGSTGGPTSSRTVDQ